jgi:peptidoglycan-associated lipoprotein
MLMLRFPGAALVLVLTMALGAAACRRDEPPVARPTPPPPSSTDAASRPPTPPSPVGEPRSVPPEPLSDDRIASASLDELNRNSPLRPVFFAYDSSELTPEARTTLDETAEMLRKYAGWAITIEGHTDERGTAEYNLALGERRAVTAQAYLVSLGIPANRLRTVSYGKEFPFDAGNSEESWSKNRRAHFVITAK